MLPPRSHPVSVCASHGQSSLGSLVITQSLPRVSGPHPSGRPHLFGGWMFTLTLAYESPGLLQRKPCEYPASPPAEPMGLHIREFPLTQPCPLANRALLNVPSAVANEKVPPGTNWAEEAGVQQPLQVSSCVLPAPAWRRALLRAWRSSGCPHWCQPHQPPFPHP